MQGYLSSSSCRCRCLGKMQITASCFQRWSSAASSRECVQLHECAAPENNVHAQQKSWLSKVSFTKPYSKVTGRILLCAKGFYQLCHIIRPRRLRYLQKVPKCRKTACPYDLLVNTMQALDVILPFDECVMRKGATISSPIPKANPHLLVGALNPAGGVRNSFLLWAKWVKTQLEPGESSGSSSPGWSCSHQHFTSRGTLLELCTSVTEM